MCWQAIIGVEETHQYSIDVLSVDVKVVLVFFFEVYNVHSISLPHVKCGSREATTQKAVATRQRAMRRKLAPARLSEKLKVSHC